MENALDRAEARMVRWMCGVSLRDHQTSEELRGRVGIRRIGDMMAESRLRWLGHVSRKDENSWVRKCSELVVEGVRPRGRPKLSWRGRVGSDMRMRGMSVEEAQDRKGWRRRLRQRPTPT